MSKVSHMVEDALFQSEVGTIVVDSESKVSSWNQWVERYSGIEANQAVGKLLSDVFVETSLSSRVIRAVDKCITMGHATVLSQKLHKHPFPFYRTEEDSRQEQRMLQMVFIKPLDMAEQGNHHCLVQIFDMTESVKREVALRQLASEANQAAKEIKEKELYLNGIFEGTSDCIMTVDDTGVVERFNENCCHMYGYNPEQLSGMQLAELIVLPLKQNPKTPDMSDFLEEQANSSASMETQAILIDRSETDIELTISKLSVNDAKRYVTVFRDITVRKRSEKLLEQMAKYDSLTGLANRTLLHDRIAHALTRAVRNKTKLAILFLDLDRFKLVNDSLGHSLGDELLKLVASRMTKTFRSSDTVARLGGDEFVVLVEGVSGEVSAQILGEKLLLSLKEPFIVKNHSLYSGASIGIAVYPGAGNTPEELVRNADVAMYRAKAEGKNQCMVYVDEMNAQARNLLELDSEIHQAITEQEFVLYFQPLIDLKTGRVTGAEALIRWVHPHRGMVSPADFIPVAEDSGVIWEMGKWIIDSAVRFVKKVHENYDSHFKVAINVSPQQFKNPDFLNLITRSASLYDVSPEAIELELTEGLLMEQTEHSIESISEISKRGFSVSIDDFGTGYSSLAYLRKFPLDILKIDQSFVADLPSSPDAISLCNAIINLAHSLKLSVIAEGVETKEQLLFLQDQGCEVAQGYFISRPLPEQEFILWLADYNAAQLFE
ncbi:EAL domain-containing protein [Vibrio europaeus]|uniref:sensor domain-containing protein n=1 Tax=Vibrio europaeus TaxID=300876 RepID=UPI0039E1259B